LSVSVGELSEGGKYAWLELDQGEVGGNEGGFGRIWRGGGEEMTLWHCVAGLELEITGSYHWGSCWTVVEYDLRCSTTMVALGAWVEMEGAKSDSLSFVMNWKVGVRFGLDPIAKIDEKSRSGYNLDFLNQFLVWGVEAENRSERRVDQAT
jgi:hypothetical protein